MIIRRRKYDEMNYEIEMLKNKIEQYENKIRNINYNDKKQTLEKIKDNYNIAILSNYDETIIFQGGNSHKRFNNVVFTQANDTIPQLNIDLY